MAVKLSKRVRAFQEKCGNQSIYPIEAAVDLLKECSTAKFAESVDVAIQLGIDPRKSEQTVRGATLLPHGTGRSVRVAVFAQGAKAEEARAAGAEFVGFDDLGEEIKKKADAGKLDFDVLIATPDAMRIVGLLGRVLGPRGLMPNPKLGTVTMDVATAVKNAKAGQATFRADKAGIIHCSIGKIKFETNSIRENLEALIHDLRKAKPSTSKGVYLKKVVLSTTMGPGLVVDMSTLTIR